MDMQRMREIVENLLPFESMTRGKPAQWVRLAIPPGGLGEIQLKRSDVKTRAECEAEVRQMAEGDQQRTIVVPPNMPYWVLVQEFAKTRLEEMECSHGG